MTVWVPALRHWPELYATSPRSWMTPPATAYVPQARQFESEAACAAWCASHAEHPWVPVAREVA